jgi:hypothetical protein
MIAWLADAGPVAIRPVGLISIVKGLGQIVLAHAGGRRRRSVEAGGRDLLPAQGQIAQESHRSEYQDEQEHEAPREVDADDQSLSFLLIHTRLYSLLSVAPVETIECHSSSSFLVY